MKSLKFTLSENGQVTPSEVDVSHDGENRVLLVEVTYPTGYENYIKTCEIIPANGTQDIKTITDGKFDLTNAVTKVGNALLQFVASTVDGENTPIWKSDVYEYYVSKSLNVTSSIADEYPEIFTQILNSFVVCADSVQATIDNALITENNKDIVVAKALEVIANAEQVAEDKIAVAGDKAIVIADTNAVSVDKDTVISAKQATELLKSDVETLKEDTEELYSDCLGIQNIITGMISDIPVKYMKNSIADMNAITTMKHGDICEIISMDLSFSSIYKYFDKDIQGNPLVTPSWVWMTDLSMVQLSKNYLLGILQLPTVATTGSYPDLINKPNRYESFITVTTGIWDYSLSDKIILTTNNLSSITNVTNGAIGQIVTDYDLTLPVGSKKAVDYNYIIATAGQSYHYTFVWTGTYYYFTRTVIV